MMDDIRNQEIEASMLTLGVAYAATFIVTIAWFANHIGF